MFHSRVDTFVFCSETYNLRARTVQQIFLVGQLLGGFKIDDDLQSGQLIATSNDNYNPEIKY